MSKRSAKLLLEDIQASLARIERYLDQVTKESFLKDEKTIDAVVCNLEIIGEAVRWLPAEFKERPSHIPWSQIAGLRHRIVHDHLGLDLRLIWQVVETSIPEFRRQVAELEGVRQVSRILPQGLQDRQTLFTR